MSKKKAKTKTSKKDPIEVNVQPIKWQPGDKRRPQGYWTGQYKPEYDDIVSRLIGSGFSENDLAYTFDVPASAIKGWKRSFLSFKKACNDGKRGQLKRLAASGMREATGYDWVATKTKTIYGADKTTIEKIEVQEIPMHQPGNASLAMFMMCNISNQLKLGNEDAFKSRQKVEVENKNLNFTVTAELVGEQIDKLAGKWLSSGIKQVEANIVDSE